MGALINGYEVGKDRGFEDQSTYVAWLQSLAERFDLDGTLPDDAVDLMLVLFQLWRIERQGGFTSPFTYASIRKLREVAGRDDLSREEALKAPFFVPNRAPKDPREFRILDPACGSGHFLLYAFDLLVVIYEEDWSAGGPLAQDYATLDELTGPDPGSSSGTTCTASTSTAPRAPSRSLRSPSGCGPRRAWKDFGIARTERPTITRRLSSSPSRCPGTRRWSTNSRRPWQAAPSSTTSSRPWSDQMTLAGEARLALEDRGAPGTSIERSICAIGLPFHRACYLAMKKCFLPAHTIPANYPLAVAWDGIPVDDSRPLRTTVTRLRAVLSLIYPDRADAIYQELVDLLVGSGHDLRPYLRGAFFDFHIKRYPRRAFGTAPIYWRLATPSGSYAVWLYYHRVDKDTFQGAQRLRAAQAPARDGPLGQRAQASRLPAPPPDRRQRKAAIETQAAPRGGTADLPRRGGAPGRAALGPFGPHRRGDPQLCAALAAAASPQGAPGRPRKCWGRYLGCAAAGATMTGRTWACASGRPRRPQVPRPTAAWPSPTAWTTSSGRSRPDRQSHAQACGTRPRSRR